MNRIPVNSSNINSIGYDILSAILEVEFKDGSIYRYYDVPDYIYKELMNAKSYGQFLSENIKYNFRYQKIK